VLDLMYITNNPQVATIAQRAGVSRIFIDLETIKKAERQAHQDSVKSNHKISDIAAIKPLLNKSDLIVRVNPIHENTSDEIEQVVYNGADIIMLPMFSTCREVEEFIKCVNGRAKICLLLETSAAHECLDDVLDLPGIDEIHIGLNDLHLSYNKDFMFELLADGTVEHICGRIAERGIRYGFGGIAKPGCGLLPSERIIAEHYRLGSSMAILSRSFCNWELVQDMNQIAHEFDTGMAEIHAFESGMASYSDEDFAHNQVLIKESVKTIVEKIQNSRKTEGVYVR